MHTYLDTYMHTYVHAYTYENMHSCFILHTCIHTSCIHAHIHIRSTQTRLHAVCNARRTISSTAFTRCKPGKRRQVRQTYAHSRTSPTHASTHTHQEKRPTLTSSTPTFRCPSLTNDIAISKMKCVWRGRVCVCLCVCARAFHVDFSVCRGCLSE